MKRNGVMFLFTSVVGDMDNSMASYCADQDKKTTARVARKVDDGWSDGARSKRRWAD